MAIKPTIYKIQLEIADSDRHCYESLAITLARHPSETLERLAVRILAFCLNYQRGLEFTRGLSSTEEPELWRHSDGGVLQQWIELGQPEPARLRKACGRCEDVVLYSYGRSADTWWQQNSVEFSSMPRLQVWQFDWPQVETVGQLISRNTRLGVNIVGGILYVDNGERSCELELSLLLEKA